MGMLEEFQVENWHNNWAQEVLKFHRGELEMTTVQFMRQNNFSRKILQSDVSAVEVEIKEEPDQANQQRGNKI